MQEKFFQISKFFNHQLYELPASDVRRPNDFEDNPAIYQINS